MVWPNIETADELRQLIGSYGEDALDLFDIRIVECEACHGEGEIEYGHGPHPTRVERCEACSGSGVVEQETQPVECDDDLTE